MRMLTVWQIELLPWYAFFMVWAVAALKLKPDKVAEPLAARLFDATYIGCAVLLLFSESLQLGPLRQRFLPASNWLGWLGVAFTYLGAAVAIWARLSLGDNWSSRVNLKVGHQLVRSGPYAYVRDPVYSGFLLAVVGIALEIGEWRGLLAIFLIAVANSLKARREEQFMVAEFGDRYVQYRRETGFLLPKL